MSLLLHWYFADMQNSAQGKGPELLLTDVPIAASSLEYSSFPYKSFCLNHGKAFWTLTNGYCHLAEGWQKNK